MIIHGDCVEVIPKLPRPAMIFADPPDGIGLTYDGYFDDGLDYREKLERWICTFCHHSPIVWLSFNSLWIIEAAEIVHQNAIKHGGWEFKSCVQVFTFGQHRQTDLCNCHRPLWRLRRCGTPLYTEQIRTPSWRQLHGDKRADPRGRIPGDVFDFPRVTGNSNQRRAWHPTQLHEKLVERCILQSTKEGDLVIDPFAGTGTTLRVCKRLNRRCIIIDVSEYYCKKIAEEHGLEVQSV